MLAALGKLTLLSNGWTLCKLCPGCEIERERARERALRSQCQRAAEIRALYGALKRLPCGGLLSTLFDGRALAAGPAVHEAEQQALAA